MIADRAALLRGMSDEHQKPSRQNRRQKRGWQRKPKNGLDCACTQWQPVSSVLNTPLLAVPGSVRTGFFTPMVFALAGSRLAGFDQWPGGAQLYHSLQAKSASGLTAVLKHLAALSTRASFNELLGAATMAAKLARAIPAHTRLSVYNLARCFAGPVFAHRVAFRLGGAHHG